jgi:DinB superfamily
MSVPFFRDPRVASLEAELNRVMSAFDVEIDALAPEAIDAAPEGQWSPVQIIWHVSKVQHWAHSKLTAGAAALPPMSTVPPGPAPGTILTLLNAFPIRDRSRRVQAPEAVQSPRGLALEAERTRWREGRVALVRTLQQIGPNLTNVRGEHPAFGTLSGWQWALWVAQHEERHLAQLREVVAGTR